MNKTIKYGIVFLGSGIFFVLVGLGLNASTIKEENKKYCLLFLGLSILSLYLGLTWKKPSYGGGIVHKYAAIAVGILSGLYSIYLFARLL